MSSAEPSATGSSSSTQNGSTKPKPPLRAIPPWLAPLRFMGVPQSVLRWQPRLPSRNWSIFLSLSISLTSLYIYDRSECKKIKAKYQGMVSHLAQEEMRPNQWPRKLNVFTAKCPGEDGSEEAVIYFKKYVKVSRETHDEERDSRWERQSQLASFHKEVKMRRHRKVPGRTSFLINPSLCRALFWVGIDVDGLLDYSLSFKVLKWESKTSW